MPARLVILRLSRTKRAGKSADPAVPGFIRCEMLWRSLAPAEMAGLRVISHSLVDMTALWQFTGHPAANDRHGPERLGTPLGDRHPPRAGDPRLRRGRRRERPSDPTPSGGRGAQGGGSRASHPSRDRTGVRSMRSMSGSIRVQTAARNSVTCRLRSVFWSSNSLMRASHARAFSGGAVIGASAWKARLER